MKSNGTLKMFSAAMLSISATGRFPSLLLLVVLISSVAHAQFAKGDLIVVRVGNGSAALTSASAPVFLDEYTPAGSYVRTVSLPTTVVGPNQQVTLAGTSIAEGALARSVDGRYITLGGYATAPGLATVGTTNSASVNRIVARIDGAGTIDATTRFAQAFDGSSIRGAITADGSAFWASGNSSNASAAGIQYIQLGSVVGGTQIMATPNNTRCVAIFNGQVYATSGLNNYTAVFAVGSGRPTMAGQTATLLPGLPATGASPYGFAMDSAKTTCYLADDRATSAGGGVQKWVWHDTVWALATTFASGLVSGVRGLTVDWTGPHPKVYATTAAIGRNQLVQFTDSNGVSPPAVIIATADSNTAFRGVAFAPTLPPANVQGSGVPAQKLLLGNYPNPFNPETMITYSIPESGIVRLSVCDVLGREAAVVRDGYQNRGQYQVAFSGAGLSSGVYYCRLQAGPISRVTRMVLLR
jgi:hypothetical protein